MTSATPTTATPTTATPATATPTAGTRTAATRTARRAIAATLALAALATACGSKGGSTVAPLGASSAGTTTFATVAGATSAPGAVTTTGAATTAVAASGPTTTGPASPGTSVLAAVTARSVRFRQFTVSVARAVTSRLDPDDFASPDGAEPSDRTYLYVEVRVKNEVSFETSFIAYDEARLVPAGGDPIKMSDGVGKAVDLVDGGATNAGWFAFEVPASFDVTGAALVFGHPGEETERLPLTGAVPAPAWPKALTLTSPGTVTFLDSSKPFTVGIRIDRATLSTSVAFDHERATFASKQALAGRRKLYVEFTADLVTTSSPSSTSEVLSYEAARLVIDGERQSGSPEMSDSTILEKGAPYHGRYVFDVPAKGKVQLAWGDITSPVLVDVPVS